MDFLDFKILFQCLMELISLAIQETHLQMACMDSHKMVKDFLRMDKVILKMDKAILKMGKLD